MEDHGRRSTAEIRETIPASAEAVFDIVHDYGRRLEWDTLLSEAYVEPEFGNAALGAITVCRGRAILRGLALRTQYISFQKGRVAAVKMLNEVPFFEAFAASIRHLPVDDERSEIVYKLSFLGKPRWARPLLHPVMRTILVWETRKRLTALRCFVENA